MLSLVEIGSSIDRHDTNKHVFSRHPLQIFVECVSITTESSLLGLPSFQNKPTARVHTSAIGPDPQNHPAMIVVLLLDLQ
jgi:hypothetical protein